MHTGGQAKGASRNRLPLLYGAHRLTTCLSFCYKFSIGRVCKKNLDEI